MVRGEKGEPRLHPLPSGQSCKSHAYIPQLASPPKARGQRQWYLSSPSGMHVPPFWQGWESQGPIREIPGKSHACWHRSEEGWLASQGLSPAGPSPIPPRCPVGHQPYHLWQRGDEPTRTWRRAWVWLMKDLQWGLVGPCVNYGPTQGHAHGLSYQEHRPQLPRC